ncbi:hypothetical protein JV16_01758 [Anoxybacillus ayderensis]|nr:hypothetical protein JV16_01758 [Anoxybacillus ayderensis]
MHRGMKVQTKAVQIEIEQFKRILIEAYERGQSNEVTAKEMVQELAQKLCVDGEK